MKATFQSTSKIVLLNGVPARIWEGETESGIKVHALITRIAADKGQDLKEFYHELQQQEPPSPDVDSAYPLRLLI